jgi:rSAM/selenodomain-associated transferase 2
MPPAPPAADGPVLSVIVPALDEEATLPATLSALLDQRDPPDFEIVLADGGSRDRTVALFESRVAEAAGRAAQRPDRAAAGAQPGASTTGRVVRSTVRGRAAQMNAGAAAARGGILLFLHADTLLPSDGLARVAAELADPAVVGGGFALSYAEKDRRLGVIAAWATLRSRLVRIHYGDQAMFVRRDLFDRAGGFEPVPLFEDLRLAKRLRRMGTIVTLNPAVTTSGRRLLQHGVTRTALWFAGLKLRHALGADPRDLARRYRDVR